MGRAGLIVALLIALCAGLTLALFPFIDLRLAKTLSDSALASSPMMPVVRNFGFSIQLLFIAFPFVALTTKLLLPRSRMLISGRAVVFLISDFQAPDFSRELAVTAKRHDLIAIRIQDERESILPPIGLITLEDAETGDQIEINAADSRVRAQFAQLAQSQLAETMRVLRRNRIDRIELRTGDEYLPALRSFFKQRERRVMVR